MATLTHAMFLLVMAFVTGLVLAACGNGTNPGGGGTPTLTNTVGSSSPTSTYWPTFEQLNIEAAGPVATSPDGRVLAAEDSSNITFYDAAGNKLGAYTSPASIGGSRWSSDSKRVMVWDTNYASLTLVSPDGSSVQTALTAVDADLSSDGRWAAAVRFGTPESNDKLEVSATNGRDVRTVASGRGIRFQGWKGDDLIYTLGNSIYAVAASGSPTPRVIAALPAGVAFEPPPPPQQHSSPDGQVLLLFARTTYWTLVGDTIAQTPQESLLLAVENAWTGPHQYLGLSPQHTLLLIDGLTGRAERDTGVEVQGAIDAVAGHEVAWTSSSDEAVHITNLDTGGDSNIGPRPVAGQIMAFGPGRFLLHGQGQTFVFEAPTSSH